MAMVDGWKILESSNLLALKSPAAIPLVNFVWGEVSDDNLARVKAFYGNCDFYSEHPKSKLVTDVTYLRVGGKNHYLSVVLDLFNN